MPKNTTKNNDFISAINRIVIGDVGSGKTIVAFLVALVYLKSIYQGQSSLLAPTEVLAFQHYQKLMELKRQHPDLLGWLEIIFLSGKQIYWNEERFTKGKFQKQMELFILEQKLDPQKYAGLFEEKSGQSVDIITLESKKPNKSKKSVKNDIIENENLLAKNIQNAVSKNDQNHDQKPQDKKIFWIGTQALLFNNHLVPDLVLVDEQHRFGVNQRQKLAKSKDSLSSHFVSFTATPIPRTLALTMYRGLKPHFLKTLQNRHPIETRIETFDNLETQIVPKIQEEIAKGRKVYVICAKVEDKEEEEKEGELAVWSVHKAKKMLDKYFTGQILLVHGKLAEKKDLLSEFKESKEKNILVSTTVVEVGVDVGLASLVVILNSERFGLAALHQIRGRVGRNDFEQNFCILVTHPDFRFSKRLRFVCKYQDGFLLAQKDLELRGSGDLVGKVQSGFGDEIDNIIGLDPMLYEAIDNIIKKIDFKNLQKTLPRLYNYLEREKEKVWGE